MGGNGQSTARQAATLTRDTGLALLRVAGEDATAFLNAQTTAALDKNTPATRFSALADPKGRVLIVFYAWREDDGWTLALAANEVEWLRAHLVRFVFRARVHIDPAPGAIPIGLVGEGVTGALAAAGLPQPDEGRTAPAGTLAITGLTGGRWLVTGDEAALDGCARTLESHVRSGTGNIWKRARLVAGEAEIRGETRGRFLPQTLGLVELGAVSFHKGCYPGQEVITRVQHRGQVKRRLALFKLDAIPDAGAKIDLEGIRIEVLDGVALPADGALVQAAAPFPFPPSLENLRMSALPGDW